MRGLHVASYAWVVLAIAPAISQSRPNPFPHRDGIRLQVEVQSTTLPMTVRLRFFTAGDSLTETSRVVAVPYDHTFSVQPLIVGVEPTDPRATVTVHVEHWRDGAVTEQGTLSGQRVLVQIQRDILTLSTGIWPVQLHIF
jgi:hypothetical protein